MQDFPLPLYVTLANKLASLGASVRLAVESGHVHPSQDGKTTCTEDVRQDCFLSHFPFLGFLTLLSGAPENWGSGLLMCVLWAGASLSPPTFSLSPASCCLECLGEPKVMNSWVPEMLTELFLFFYNIVRQISSSKCSVNIQIKGSEIGPKSAGAPKARPL